MAPHDKTLGDSKESSVRSQAKKLKKKKRKLRPLSPENTVACSDGLEAAPSLSDEKIAVSLSSCNDITMDPPNKRTNKKKAVPLKKRRVSKSVLKACANVKPSPRPSLSTETTTSSNSTDHPLVDVLQKQPIHPSAAAIMQVSSNLPSNDLMLQQDAMTNYIVTAAVRALERSNQHSTTTTTTSRMPPTTLSSLSNSTAMSRLSLIGNYPLTTASRRASLNSFPQRESLALLGTSTGLNHSQLAMLHNNNYGAGGHYTNSFHPSNGY